jgi:hypothetical protein
MADPIPNIGPHRKRCLKRRAVKSGVLASSESSSATAPGIGKTYEMLQRARKKDG